MLLLLLRLRLRRLLLLLRLLLGVKWFTHDCLFGARFVALLDFAPSKAAATELVKQAATVEDRYPTPQLIVVVEDHSMARWLTSRMNPAHHDAPDHQVADFPALGAMPPAKLAALRQKLFRSDDESVRQFLAALVQYR